MKLLYKILSIFLLLLISSYFLISQGQTNPVIEKAKQLILNKQFDYALQILNEELKNDKTNEDVIKELIKYTELKKAELEASQNNFDNKNIIPTTKKQSSDTAAVNKKLYKKLLRSKNKNILLSFELMKEKKFNEALRILSDELLIDENNEELIMELIVEIENEKERIIAKAYNAKEKIKSGDFKEAEGIIDKFKDSGEFDSTINNTIDKIEKEKDPLQKINEFNNLVSIEGEKFLTVFDIANALLSYKKALDIFRLNEINTSDQIFNEALIKFNEIEKNLFNSNISDMIIKDLSSDNLADLQKNIKILNDGIIQWQKFELELNNTENILEKSNDKTKALIQYEAYKSIIEKYHFAINRSIQKNGIPFLTNILTLIEKNIEKINNNKGNNNEILNEIDTLIVLINEIEKFAFYNFSVNLLNYPIIERGKGNIVRYLNYIYRKNNILITFEESKIVSDINNTNVLIKEAADLITNRKLYSAKDKLKQSVDIMYKINSKLDKYKKTLKSYANLNTEEIKKHNKNLTAHEDNIIKLNNKVLSDNNDLTEKIKYAEFMIDQGDKIFDTSVKIYNQKDYENAKNNFISSKDKYVETLISLESEYVEKQIDAINKYLADIEDIVFKIDMKKADDFKEKAIDSFYKDDPENAKIMIDNAENIYNNHKDENENLYAKNIEDIKFWRDKILIYVKVKSGSKLTIDDPAYEEITELMNSAKNNFNQNKFDDAFKNITLVLNEKPYYEDARIFEIKILLNLDKKIGEQIYENRFNDAKAKFDREIFDQALIAFNQLLQFNKDTTDINKFIFECRKKLGLIKQELTQADKNKAVEYISEANNLYINGDYGQAYDKTLLALRIWADVPKGKELKAQIEQRTKIKTVQLTKENEILYKRAGAAYAQGNYELAYNLTLEILKTQDIPSVRDLNKRADAQRNK